MGTAYCLQSGSPEGRHYTGRTELILSSPNKHSRYEWTVNGKTPRDTRLVWNRVGWKERWTRHKCGRVRTGVTFQVKGHSPGGAAHLVGTPGLEV